MFKLARPHPPTVNCYPKAECQKSKSSTSLNNSSILVPLPGAVNRQVMYM